jgi:hypothetical protein
MLQVGCQRMIESFLLLLATWLTPALPGGKPIATETSRALLRPPASLKKDVDVAKTPPTVELMVYPGQSYQGGPWSVWGDGTVVDGRYYSTIGDHFAPGNSYVYEYDPRARSLRRVVDVQRVLGLPAGHYTPGKIHGRLERGSDGWLYFSTYRGSEKGATDAFHYQGDWILRHDPETGKTEVVGRPLPGHSIPASVLDPKRMIFYGGTITGKDQPDHVWFFAYDLRKRKLLYAGPGGPHRALILAPSTGRVYYTRGWTGTLMRFDPDAGGPPVTVSENAPTLRAASQETRDGHVYAVSQSGAGGSEATLWALDTKTEKVRVLGPAEVGTRGYITTLDADPSGRYVYYAPGAHGGCADDGTPIVQYDTATGRRKVITFLHPIDTQRLGGKLQGTFSMALDTRGETLFATWNASRQGDTWDSVVLSVVHIPASERAP